MIQINLININRLKSKSSSNLDLYYAHDIMIDQVIPDEDHIILDTILVGGT